MDLRSWWEAEPEREWEHIGRESSSPILKFSV
jgi:hypothetical protein